MTAASWGSSVNVMLFLPWVVLLATDVAFEEGMDLVRAPAAGNTGIAPVAAGMPVPWHPNCRKNRPC
ncbi:hypothetical protein [Frankia gtarii]|uniref:hypothetical protein n=1 Tax=Frankia gtarii TaxID=2950102 RepID=UPI0021C16621|nr:hypothetical protein [Frankia gtarii]